MELQNPMVEFDQTNPGLGSSKQIWRHTCCLEINKHVKNKRSLEDSFGQYSLKTLPTLLVWSGQPNEEDDRGGKKNRHTCPKNENKEDENRVVGWPPIKSIWRKKKLHHDQQYPRIQIRNDRLPICEHGTRGSSSLFVKVKMEGVALERKIDLRHHTNYETLTNDLISVFAKYQNLEEEDSASYTLTYQDEGGDWRLAGDVSWRSFIDSVQRLEILRNGIVPV